MVMLTNMPCCHARSMQDRFQLIYREVEAPRRKEGEWVKLTSTKQPTYPFLYEVCRLHRHTSTVASGNALNMSHRHVHTMPATRHDRRYEQFAVCEDRQIVAAALSYDTLRLQLCWHVAVPCALHDTPHLHLLPSVFAV